MDEAQLIDQIHAAFAGVEPPSAKELLNSHCEECVETSWTFSQKRWEDRALDVGQYEETCLLTPAAWRYYLPTVLIWCVRDTKAVDALVDSTIHQLTPGPGGPDQWLRERTDGYNTAQQCAIAAFLEWCCERWPEDEDAPVALRFWRPGSCRTSRCSGQSPAPVARR